MLIKHIAIDFFYYYKARPCLSIFDFKSESLNYVISNSNFLLGLYSKKNFIILNNIRCSAIVYRRNDNLIYVHINFSQLSKSNFFKCKNRGQNFNQKNHLNIFLYPQRNYPRSKSIKYLPSQKYKLCFVFGSLSFYSLTDSRKTIFCLSGGSKISI